MSNQDVITAPLFAVSDRNGAVNNTTFVLIPTKLYEDWNRSTKPFAVSPSPCSQIRVY